MKAMVTGAAGLLGSWIAKELISRGTEVVAVDNLVGGYMTNVPKDCYWLLGESVGDIRSSEVALAMKGCGVVFHCAALPYEGLSVFSPTIITDNIIGGTVALAVAAINNGVQRFVNCSSMARYGVGLPPFSEEHEPRPVDPYGIAKLAAERQLNVLGKTHGMGVAHIVPHNIIGPNQRYNDPYRNVAAIMVNRILLGLPVVVYGTGEQQRCFTFVNDVAPLITEIGITNIHFDSSNYRSGEVFNVGPDEGLVSINQLLDVILEVMGLTRQQVDIVHLPPRPCEVHTAYCLANKIRNRFGWEARTSLGSGLTQLVAWIKDMGAKPFSHHLPIEIVNTKAVMPQTWKKGL